ncbi:MAG: hypothetical protein RR620_10900 [Clostridium sp.]
MHNKFNNEDSIERIDLHSEMFLDMLAKLDTSIKAVLKQIHSKKFEGGKVTLNLDIQGKERVKTMNKVDEHGELIEFDHQYLSTEFDYKVGITLNKKFKETGGYKCNKELIKDEEDNFIFKPISDNQMKLDMYLDK